MRHRTLVLLLLVAVSVQVATLAQDELPFQVLITIAKAAAGMKPSDDDMKCVRDYSLHHATESIDGVTFGDVVAILDTLVLTGSRPPAAEIARLRTWADGMKARQKKLVEETKRGAAKDLEKSGTKGEKGAPRPNALVTIVADSIATKTARDVDVKTTTHFELGLPATVHVHGGGDFQLDWDDYQASVSKTSVSGTFHVQSDGVEHKTPVHVSSTIPIHVGSGAARGSMTMGSIAIPKGAKRPYWQTTTLVMGVRSPEGMTPNPGGPLTLDNAIDEGPFSPLAHIPEAYRAQAAAGMLREKDVSEAGRNARCTFDGEKFLKSFEEGGPFTQPFDYSYVLRKVTGTGDSKETDVLDMKVHVELRLNDPPIEALIEAANQPDYDHWIPLGPDPAKPAETHGNKLLVRVRLVKQGTDDPVAVSHSTIFRFSSVSHQPGVCMNWPHDKADTDPDLRFEADDNKDGEISPDKTAFTTNTAAGDADTATVTCFDYGAYGVLEAEVHVGSLTLQARRPSDRSHRELKIPKDENDNHIADAWEEAQGIYERNLPATWDEEDLPEGKSKGDGYTLYEEYRGFALTGATDENVAFARLEESAKSARRRKKVIVRLSEQDRHDMARGVARFAEISGARVFFANRLDTLKFLPGDGSRAKSETYPRWVNFNARTGDGVDFGPRQFAINIVSVLEGQGPGFTPPFDIDSQWCPENTRFIELHRDVMEAGIRNDANFYKTLPDDFAGAALTQRYCLWRNKDAQFLRKIGAQALANWPAISASYFRWSVTHELGHALGVHHHNEQALIAAEDAFKPIAEAYEAAHDEWKARVAAGTAQGLKEPPRPKGAPSMFDDKYWAGPPYDCPMNYWRRMDPRILVPLLSQSFDPEKEAWAQPEPDPVEPPKTTPVDPPRDSGRRSPWKYCPGCQKQMAFHR